MKKDKVHDSILEDFASEIHFTYQVLSEDEKLLHSLVTKIEKSVQQMEEQFRVLCIDLEKYKNFSMMAEDMIKNIYADPKFCETDVFLWRDEADITESENDASFQLNCILTTDFPDNGIYTLIILEHYEHAANIWNESDFGYLRALLCDSSSTSMVVASKKEMSKVSELPKGSSPLYNIFTTIMKVER
ncbi:MAG: hypothetical protein PUD20_00990 [bacterium]|nr:hypothetical protein [bacterium]